MSYSYSTLPGASAGPSAGTPRAGGLAVAPPPVAAPPSPASSRLPSRYLGGDGTRVLGTYTGIAALGTSGGVESKNSGQPVAGRGQNADAAGSALVKRYALQSVARSWLPEERVEFCMRGVRAPLVSLYCSPARRSASLGGVMVCGSVWACPVCAAKIAERRRAELAGAMRTWTEGGGVVLVAALTFSHRPNEALAPMLERFLGAYRRMWGNKAGKTIRERFGVEHSVRALEVTHGDANGWHPHVHVLLFLRGEVDVKALEDALYAAWEQAARASGLSMTRERGVVLQPATDGAALYIAKWGHEPERRAWEAPDELTKANSKRGRDGRRTPFDLLRAGLAGEDADARLLFREFAAAFKGRHQLQPSRGAWAALGVKTRTDEEVARAREGDAYLLALLEPHEFRVIVGNDAVPELLLSARDGDLEAVNAFLADFDLPPREPLVAAVAGHAGPMEDAAEADDYAGLDGDDAQEKGGSDGRAQADEGQGPEGGAGGRGRGVAARRDDGFRVPGQGAGGRGRAGRPGSRVLRHGVRRRLRRDGQQRPPGSAVEPGCRGDGARVPHRVRLATPWRVLPRSRPSWLL